MKVNNSMFGKPAFMIMEFSKGGELMMEVYEFSIDQVPPGLTVQNIGGSISVPAQSKEVTITLKGKIIK